MVNAEQRTLYGVREIVPMTGRLTEVHHDSGFLEMTVELGAYNGMLCYTPDQASVFHEAFSVPLPAKDYVGPIHVPAVTLVADVVEPREHEGWVDIVSIDCLTLES